MPDFLTLPTEHPCCKTSQQMDETLRSLMATAPNICLVATGGYGRGALAPFSDIDILFLHDAPLLPTEEATISTLLHNLWDQGKRTGNAVRTVVETMQLAQQDHATFTSLIDARYLVGNIALYETFALSVRTLLNTHGHIFSSAKCRELRQRHAAISSKPVSIFKSRGGLRDVQTLHWLAQATINPLRLSPQDAARLSAHHQFLWDLRSTLTEDAPPTLPEGVADKMQEIWDKLLAPSIATFDETKAA